MAVAFQFAQVREIFREVHIECEPRTFYGYALHAELPHVLEMAHKASRPEGKSEFQRRFQAQAVGPLPGPVRRDADAVSRPGLCEAPQVLRVQRAI
jgi:hypothetical protein